MTSVVSTRAEAATVSTGSTSYSHYWDWWCAIWLLVLGVVLMTLGTADRGRLLDALGLLVILCAGIFVRHLRWKLILFVPTACLVSIAGSVALEPIISAIGNDEELLVISDRSRDDEETSVALVRAVNDQRLSRPQTLYEENATVVTKYRSAMTSVPPRDPSGSSKVVEWVDKGSLLIVTGDYVTVEWRTAPTDYWWPVLDPDDGTTGYINDDSIELSDDPAPQPSILNPTTTADLDTNSLTNEERSSVPEAIYPEGATVVVKFPSAITSSPPSTSGGTTVVDRVGRGHLLIVTGDYVTVDWSTKPTDYWWPVLDPANGSIGYINDDSVEEN